MSPYSSRARISPPHARTMVHDVGTAFSIRTENTMSEIPAKMAYRRVV